MRYALTIVFVFFLTVIQTTLIRSVEIFNVIPNLLLVAVICYSLCKGDLKALVFGVVCGLVLDFTGGRVVGVNTLLCTYAAFLCYLLHGGLFNNNVFVAAVFVLIISFVYEFLFYMMQFFIWGETDIAFALLHKILPGALYNAVAAVPVYPIMRRLSESTATRQRVKW